MGGISIHPLICIQINLVIYNNKYYVHVFRHYYDVLLNYNICLVIYE